MALGRALAIDPALLLLDEPLSALDAPLRRSLRDELRAILSEWGTAAVLVTHDFTEAYQLADRIVVYEGGRVIQSAPRAELLWQPASEAVARIMGLRNVLHGTVVKATPDRIQISWRGQMLEAVNSPTRSYLPPPDSPIAFFIRPEYVRLIRKDRGTPDAAHHMNLMRGRIVGESDFGTMWSLRLRLDAPGAPAQGDFDLEVEVPRLVYEILDIERDRHWEFSIHRGIDPRPADVSARAVVELAGVRVAYGPATVLDVPALGVAPGEVLAVIGPNGSGKSTLLRVVGLLERPAQGTVRIHGRSADARHALAERRRMATVFQRPLLADMTVAENVALGLRFRGLGADAQDTRVSRWLERLNILPLRDQRARTLSGGAGAARGAGAGARARARSAAARRAVRRARRALARRAPARRRGHPASRPGHHLPGDPRPR